MWTGLTSGRQSCHERSYARAAGGGHDPGGGVFRKPRWDFADCSRTHGRQVCWGRMYTGQDTNRGGITAEDSVALGAVLWHCQVLPQRGKRVSCRYSAEYDEHSDPQTACSHGCPTAGRREKRRSSSFDRQERKPTGAARKQAERNSRSHAESGRSANCAHRELHDCDAYARRWSRNTQPGPAEHFSASTLRCSSTG